jgi:hypothetical protein
MGTDLAPLVDRITALVSEPASGSPERLRAVEHTLTDGYAHALLLEGETLKLEREIGSMVAQNEADERAERLTSLANRLAATERELNRLRALLAELRGRTDGVRRERL